MLRFALMMVAGMRDRCDEVRDRGASALEWAIIAAIVVVAASAIGAVVYHVVTENAAKVTRCGNLPAGSSCK